MIWILLIVILYFLIAFVSYYFLAKKKINNVGYIPHDIDTIQCACIFWPVYLLAIIFTSPITIMDNINHYIFKKYSENEKKS